MKKKTRLLIRDSFFSTILSCILVGILILTIKNLTFFNPFVKAFTDFSLLDIYYSENFEPTNKVNTDIIIVNVGNHERDLLVPLLENIISHDPKVIGIDVIFEELKEPKSDSLLANILKDESIITSFNIDSVGDFKESHPFFTNINPKGYANFNFNTDGYVIRRFKGIIEENGYYRSFASEITKQYLGENWFTLNYGEKLKRERVINYFGNQDDFLVLDFTDFIDYEKMSILKDKIVIVGYVGSKDNIEFDVQDKFFTPLNKHPVGKSDRDMYGAIIHANIVNMLITKDLFFEIPLFWVLFLTFISMYFATMLLIKMDKKFKVTYKARKQTYLFIYSIALVVIAMFLFKYGIVLQIVPIIAGTLFAGSYVKYYKHLVRYIKRKRKWKSYVK